MIRPICIACGYGVCAINYKKANGIHYRSRCAACIRSGKKKKYPVPRWLISGYEKKKICDLCGFKSRYPSQMLVYNMDGNLNNNNLLNLRSVCLNCSIHIQRQDPVWRPGDLKADF